VIPRIVIAGTGSGVGKTTVACGLIGALRARGLNVQSFKVGPDYIDPSYHALASGRLGRNLDAFLSGPELIAPLALHGAQGADVAVIEGVMGLFDGASSQGELASTAHVAKLLQAPVVLVVDASKMARSVAAIVHGYRSFDPQLRLAGVVLNCVGSAHHEQILLEALEDLGPPAVPVLGALLRDERLAAPERHLGLVPAGEIRTRANAALTRLADTVASQVDLDAVLALAGEAPPLAAQPWSPAISGRPVAGARIAVAGGPAFSFHYQENLELLQAVGAELLELDPLHDEQLPEGTGGLLLAGGFPEVYGEELAANAHLRDQVAAFAASGRPVLAECGGLLYLGEELDSWPMCRVLPVKGRMTERLTLGYREACAHTATPWLAAGETVRGHEFHYSQVEPADAGEHAAWKLAARGRERLEGFAVGSVQASFMHVHWAAHPQIGARFAAACR
jgi:cobyrinic acid a,c-diamide synthase